MPDLLGATNPVPGHDRAAANRSTPVLPENTPQLKNVADPSRVIRADGQTERQDSNLQGGRDIRYDSNFQTFLQRLQNAPSMAEALATIFSGQESTVVLSGMQEGIAAEMASLIGMLQMDEAQLKEFMGDQLKLGSRFSGGLFALLRNAYGKASSNTVRTNILQFLKSYSDFSSTGHIQNSMRQNLARMADAMPARWGDQLRQLAVQLENSFAAGDRQESLQLLQKEIFPLMSKYVGQTHDMGLPRQLLSLLALDTARYENGSEEMLLDNFHQLRGYGTLKGMLSGVDDQMLLKLLQSSQGDTESTAARFSDQLIETASRALRGEGGVEMQQGFQNLMAAMLINESVYMPINHYLLPLEMDGQMLFSELWVDPDAEGGTEEGNAGSAARILLKVDVQSLGLFDVILNSQRDGVEVQIACPEGASPYSKQIEQDVSQILARNNLTPLRVSARKMERPVALTEVFPQMFDGKDGINVKA